MALFFVKRGENTHLVQLRVSLDLKQDSGSEARRKKARKENVCRSEKSKFHEILKPIQNI